MIKNRIAIFFSVLFMAVVTVPSILTVIDDSIDVSMFYSLSEEEDKEMEKDIEVEVFLSDIDKDDSNLNAFSSKEALRYYFKTYPKPHLNLISPPPESQLL